MAGSLLLDIQFAFQFLLIVISLATFVLVFECSASVDMPDSIYLSDSFNSEGDLQCRYSGLKNSSVLRVLSTERSGWYQIGMADSLQKILFIFICRDFSVFVEDIVKCFEFRMYV